MQQRKLDKLVSGNRVRFGQFASVQDINYLDATVTKAGGRELSQWQKWLKANQFVFVSIHHQRYLIGFSVANLKLLSNAFVYIFDKTTGELLTSRKLSLLAKKTHFSTTPNEGKIQFERGQLQVSLTLQADAIHVQINSRLCELEATITPSQTPMCLSTRAGLSGWVYTQKQMALTCQGHLNIKGEQPTEVTLNHNNCLAGIDWTLGYMRRETFWNWANMNVLLSPDSVSFADGSKSKDYQRFGLNLSCGVNETSFTENACWLDDEQYHLPLIIFDYDQQDLLKSWRIHSQDKTVDLTFTPADSHSEHKNAVIIASHFNQMIGTFSGCIHVDNQKISFNETWGLAESFYAKW